MQDYTIYDGIEGIKILYWSTSYRTNGIFIYYNLANRFSFYENVDLIVDDT